MTDKILSRLQQKYSLTAIEAGEFAKLKANGMTPLPSGRFTPRDWDTCP